MQLFLDCEWADTLASELVSIALVATDCGDPFYAERNPLPVDPTPWVKAVVYPLLERGRFAMSDATMVRSLREFIARVPKPTICYEAGHDRALCQYVIDGLEVPEPEGPLPRDLRWERLDGLLLAKEQWWRAHPEQRPWRHHARIDALALRGAYLRPSGIGR
jgi:hypothetical protein